MLLNDEIVKHGLELAAGHTAIDIRIGLGYTAVLLDDGRCGLAYTLHEKEYESCCVMPDAGKLAGRRAAGTGAVGQSPPARPHAPSVWQ